MAGRRTYQYIEVFSVNREQFLETVVRNKELSKKDLRVIMHLITFLDSTTYKEISTKQIARDLDISKKDVENSLESLMFEGIIDEGSTSHTSNGYKLLF